MSDLYDDDILSWSEQQAEQPLPPVPQGCPATLDALLAEDR